MDATDCAGMYEVLLLYGQALRAGDVAARRVALEAVQRAACELAAEAEQAH